MRILFLKFGNFSYANDNILKRLKAEYPEHNIDIIDVWNVLKYKISYYHYFINIYFFAKEYGKDLVSGQKHWKSSLVWFFATSYTSMQISHAIRKLSQGKEYKFTFQTQSIFNGKIDGVPHYVYTDHTTLTNLLYPNINPKQYMRSKRFIEKSEIKIYQDSKIIFTCGSLIAYSLINQYNIPKEKVVIAFAGSNVPNTDKPNASKYYSRNILFVGTVWERKGGPMLLSAFKNVLNKFPDATLTIVGCKPENISCPNCTVIGSVPVGDIHKYYNAANVFCLPSLREPFGFAFIEAMNYRLPIIANNIGCIPDLVKNDYNGYLIDNDVNDYTNAICELFANPEKSKQMGENGYRYAQSRFTWELVGKTIKSNIG
jgi:glycosyltransferase involved in cell wall biosynthesis